MGRNLSDKENEQLKRLLSGLQKAVVSKKARQKFTDELYSMNERSPEKKSVPYGIRIPGIILPVPRLALALSGICMIFIISTAAFIGNLPVLENITGTVKVQGIFGSGLVLAKNNQRLWPMSVIKTYDDGKADITSGKKYSMRLRPESEIVLAHLPMPFQGKINYQLNKGNVLAYYAGKKQGHKGEFCIETDDLSATAVGTDFMVKSISPVSGSWVGVLDGVVRVAAARKSNLASAPILVQSREETWAKPGMPPAFPRRMSEDDWLDMSELYAVGIKPQVALLISSGPTRTSELLNLTPLYITDEKDGSLPPALREAAEALNKAAKDDTPSLHQEAIKKVRDIVDKSKDKRYTIHFLLFIGAYQYQLELYQEAINTFLEAAQKYPDSRLASIAWCAIGKIRAEKLGDQQGAWNAYKVILDKYPISPEGALIRDMQKQ